VNLLVPVHVVANLVWIGSILAVGLLLVRGPGDAKQRGEAGRLVYRSLAVPGFVASFVMGVVQLARDPAVYFKLTKFMHAKLPLALIVIALHHVIGARARRMAAGEAEDAGPTFVLVQILAACAFASALLALLKPFLARHFGHWSASTQIDGAPEASGGQQRKPPPRSSHATSHATPDGDAGAYSSQVPSTQT
jgi:protoporphyrinogen IX oxidase